MGVMKRNIPDEITAFKEKFFFGLTVRQLICGSGILAMAIPTGIYGSKIMPEDIVGYLIMLEVFPLAAIGWFNYNDMPIEQVAKKVFVYYFGTQKRKWQYKSTENRIHDSLIQIELDELTDNRNEELRLEKKQKKEAKKQLRRDRKKRKNKKRKGAVHNAD